MGTAVKASADAPQMGGTVETVLASPRIEPAPATLEEARTLPVAPRRSKP